MFLETRPDGTKIAFESDHDDQLSVEIYMMNADGTNPVRITDNPALDEIATWSSDGTKIAFGSGRD